MSILLNIILTERNLYILVFAFSQQSPAYFTSSVLMQCCWFICLQNAIVDVFELITVLTKISSVYIFSNTFTSCCLYLVNNTQPNDSLCKFHVFFGIIGLSWRICRADIFYVVCKWFLFYILRLPRYNNVSIVYYSIGTTKVFYLYHCVVFMGTQIFHFFLFFLHLSCVKINNSFHGNTNELY